MRKEILPKKLQFYCNNTLDLILGSLIALCFTFPSLLTLDTHKYSAQFADYAFSLAITPLIFSLLISRASRIAKIKKPLFLRYVGMGAIGILAPVTGLLAIFWYVLPKAAMVLLVAGIFCFNTFHDYEKALMQELETTKTQLEKNCD